MTPFTKGDIVRHTSRFLRSIQWITGVPINGKVEHVRMPKWKGSPESNALVTVQWCDQPMGETTVLLAVNLEYDPRIPRDPAPGVPHPQGTHPPTTTPSPTRDQHKRAQGSSPPPPPSARYHECPYCKGGGIVLTEDERGTTDCRNCGGNGRTKG